MDNRSKLFSIKSSSTAAAASVYLANAGDAQLGTEVPVVGLGEGGVADGAPLEGGEAGLAHQVPCAALEHLAAAGPGLTCRAS